MNLPPPPAAPVEPADDAPAGDALSGCSPLIRQMVQERRQTLCRTPDGTPAPNLDGHGLWGLALSGGGIRSAIFCFGLIKALAGQRLLNRFDVLSTVSGGGYIGSALGRLFDAAKPADGTPGHGQAAAHIERQLGQADATWFGHWLRANGRYLFPQSANGVVYALVIYLRNLLAIHVEIGVLGLLVGAVLAVLNLSVWTLGLQHVSNWDTWMGHRTAWPTLWLLLPALALPVGTYACAYWSVGERPGPTWRRLRWFHTAIWVGIMVASALLGWLDDAGRWPAWFAPVGLGAGAMWVSGHLLALRTVAAHQNANVPPHAWAEAVRRDLTVPLERLGQWGVALFTLGLLDRVAWYLVFEGGSVTLFSTVLALLAMAARAGIPRWTSGDGTTRLAGRSMSLVTLAHWLGLGLLGMLCIVWVCAAYALVIRYTALMTGTSLDVAASLGAACALALTCLAYMAGTGWSVDFLNLSSLHGFYRSRLVRAFLGAANPQRLPAMPESSVLQRTPAGQPITTVVRQDAPGDDVLMTDYAPHRAGGPVHLLNICANQTLDQANGLLNQDRQGQGLTLAPHGHIRLGLRGWQRPPRAMPETLGLWMAVSGAALAPGLGSMTRTGISVLTMIAGLRLGYWWDCRDETPTTARSWRERLGRLNPLRKTRLVTQEMLGKFDTRPDSYWYLSDGGHFENTGAYALLAERARLIVVADCGADPTYAFADLENLVRKARIDMGVKITFMRPTHNAPASVLGGLDDLASPESQACISVAHIAYATGEEGVMVVVKPNMYQGLPVDLANFKRDNPDFPQQTTTDQSFDEAQWESYFVLGQALGQNLGHGQLLEHLGGAQAQVHLRSHFEPDTTVRATDTPTAAGVTATGRTPARTAMHPVVSASLGLGAVATASLGLWQGLDTLRTDRDKADELQRSTLQQLVDGYASGQRNATQLGATAARLIGLVTQPADGGCDEASTAWFRRSSLGQCVLQDTLQRCSDTPASNTLLCKMLLSPDVLSCLRAGPGATAQGGRLRYWGVQEEAPSGDWDECGSSSTAAAVAAPRPTAVPGAVPGAATRASSATEATTQVCAGVVIHSQVFNPLQRERLRTYRDLWKQAGALVPPPVNVLAESLRSGQPRPEAPQAVTLIYHDDTAKQCAQAIQASMLPSAWTATASVQALPSHLSAMPRTLEIRWPATLP